MNGFRNRDTYYVNAALGEDTSNYRWVTRNVRALMQMDDEKLRYELERNVRTRDRINWRAVDIREIRETLQDY